MAITTVDGLIAGAVPMKWVMKAVLGTAPIGSRLTSWWGANGIPGPGGFDATLPGVNLSSTSAQVAGQVPFADPGAGNTYLTRFEGCNSDRGAMLLLDRLWHNGIAVTTGAQTINSAAWPARDNNGSTNGEGVFIGLEVETATSTNSPTITVTYTNSANVGSKTSTNISATTPIAPPGYFVPLSLAAGDVGVRSVQSVSLSASWTVGAIHLVAYRVLAVIDLPAASYRSHMDALSGGMVRMYNGSVPFFVCYQNSTANSHGPHCTLNWAQG